LAKGILRKKEIKWLPVTYIFWCLMQGHIAAALDHLDFAHLVVWLFLISLLHYPMISLAGLIYMMSKAEKLFSFLTCIIILLLVKKRNKMLKAP
jgi:hypothetical protein